MTALHIFPIFGVGSRNYSLGLVGLAEKVRKAVGAQVIVHAAYKWNAHKAVEADIRKLLATDKIMLVGLSGGANETTIIARNVAPRRIDLIVAYHPSAWMGNRAPVGANVARIIEIYGRNFFNWGGRPLLKTTLGFRGTRENIHSKAAHVAVDDDTGLHAVIVQRVLEMMKVR